MAICEYGLLDYGLPVYGACSVLYWIDPDSGPLPGGTSVEIGGSAFLFEDLNDEFADGVLDPILWTSATVGAASSVAETDALRLQAGIVAGDSATVESVAQVGDTDTSVRFTINSAAPADDVTGAALRLWVDANNYVQVALITGPRPRYQATVVVGGMMTEAAVIPTSDVEGELRIIRLGTTVYFYANDTEILRAQFVSSSANIRLVVTNDATATPAIADFSDFRVRTMVVFGTEPMLDADVVSDDRIRGTTPPGIEVGVVTIHFATGLATLDDFVDAFTYEDPAAFLVLSTKTNAVDTWVANDPTLRNRRSGRPGFLR